MIYFQKGEKLSENKILIYPKRKNTTHAYAITFNLLTQTLFK